MISAWFLLTIWLQRSNRVEKHVTAYIAVQRKILSSSVHCGYQSIILALKPAASRKCSTRSILYGLSRLREVEPSREPFNNHQVEPRPSAFWRAGSVQSRAVCISRKHHQTRSQCLQQNMMRKRHTCATGRGEIFCLDLGEVRTDRTGPAQKGPVPTFGTDYWCKSRVSIGPGLVRSKENKLLRSFLFRKSCNTLSQTAFTKGTFTICGRDISN